MGHSADVSEYHCVKFSIKENTKPAKLHKTQEQYDKHCDHSRRTHSIHVSALLSTTLGRPMHISISLCRSGTTAAAPRRSGLANLPCQEGWTYRTTYIQNYYNSIALSIVAQVDAR